MVITLQVRRIMEGNRRMGMVITDPTTGLVADFACEVEITECEPLSDGRFFLEVESRRRFRILNHWDQDGYRVAEIEWVQDVCPAEGTREKAEIEAHVGSVNDLAFCFPNKQLCVVTCEEDRCYSCPTFIAAVSRIQVVSNSLGTFAMLLVLLLGGFIVAKGRLLRILYYL
ncbi:hypothetical protein POM88_023493 [Heracleum sosnowskyi]|uniref:Lon N-terminal domain-containing protein n=1 Tax=Heracleum sosnowskyi TaxID=360622 RepID=A0AAD8MVZ1_9APIA|nr:hypothetical protein POM88_023493 [Heracleum sosnowskyi]